MPARMHEPIILPRLGDIDIIGEFAFLEVM